MPLCTFSPFNVPAWCAGDVWRVECYPPGVVRESTVWDHDADGKPVLVPSASVPFSAHCGGHYSICGTSIEDCKAKVQAMYVRILERDRLDVLQNRARLRELRAEYRTVQQQRRELRAHARELRRDIDAYTDRLRVATEAL